MRNIVKYSVLLGITCLITAGSFYYNDYKIKKEATSSEVVSEWVNDLFNKRYVEADKIKKDNSVILLSATYNKKNTEELYKMVLDKIIDESKVVSVNKVSDTGYTYEVEVPVWGTPQSASSLKEQVQQLSKDYTSKLITESEYKSKLNTLIIKTLDSYLIKTDTKTVSFTLETKQGKGNLELLNTDNAIKILLDTSNTSDILKWYSNQLNFNIAK